MAWTEKTVYKIDCTSSKGKSTITLPDPLDTIDGDTLADAESAFAAVGLTITNGYRVTTRTQDKQYPTN